LECDLKSIDLKSTHGFTVVMPKRNPLLAAFGRNVRKRREAKGLTQEALAEKAELDRTYISGIERGARNASMLSIARIAKALGSSISELSREVER
jgi:transcriptional regulator with XRE-family HTH domain